MNGGHDSKYYYYYLHFMGFHLYLLHYAYASDDKI